MQAVNRLRVRSAGMSDGAEFDPICVAGDEGTNALARLNQDRFATACRVLDAGITYASWSGRSRSSSGRQRSERSFWRDDHQARSPHFGSYAGGAMNKLVSVLLWPLIAIVGAFAFAALVLGRVDTVDSVWHVTAT